MENIANLGNFDENQSNQNGEEELLVFGYSCKLFRDDEKASYIDNGQHLIPWMGDNNMMIDRFDVRGALYDLSAFNVKHDPIEETMTEAEKKTEQLCEQERYFALYHDELHYQTLHEEESKRLQVEINSGYNQIGLNYAAMEETSSNDQGPPAISESVQYNPSNDDEPFIPSDFLNIPYGMEVPKTMKQHKIILKTAKFVATQGAQMEIVIKTKQSGNPMFNFLSFDNPLSIYYKHIVSLVRNGKLRLEEEKATTNADEQKVPSNFSQNLKPDLTPDVKTSPARPLPNCPYSKLTSNIQGSRILPGVEEQPDVPAPVTQPHPVVQPTPVPVQLTKSKPASQAFAGLVDYPTGGNAADDTEEESDHAPCPPKAKVEAVYDYRTIDWPPPETQMVIDKMACFITKNGPGFEDVVRSRRDPRMGFLEKKNKYYPYFMCKIKLYDEVYGDIFSDPVKLQEWSKKRQWPKNSSSGPDHSKTNGARTISFSIKSREQEPSLTSHTTFPVESSTSEEDEDMDDVEREKRREAREKRRLERRKRIEKEKKEREEFLRKERHKKALSRKQDDDDDEESGNEDLYDIFRYAKEMEKDKSGTSTPKDPFESKPPTKLEQRKQKAAQFLSKLKEKDADKPIYGPKLPDELMEAKPTPQLTPAYSSDESMESDPPTPEPTKPIDPIERSPKDSSPLEKSPIDPIERSPTPPSIMDFLTKTKVMEEKDNSKSPTVSDLVKESDKVTDMNNDKQDSLVPIVVDRIAESQGRDSEKESHSHRSRSRKKHKKSLSRSPSSRKARKKKKKYVDHHHKRKKKRSRSRSQSKHRYKSHRSHKKKHRSHSKRDKEKSRRKHKRRRRSSSVSSLPSSDSASSASSLPSDSAESEVDVHVIESDEEKSCTRESSVVSLPTVGDFKASLGKGESTKETTPDVEERCLRSTTESPSLSAKPSALPALETSNSCETPLIDTDKALFDPNKSSAMAKIAQGLRAKLHAMLEKESNS